MSLSFVEAEVFIPGFNIGVGRYRDKIGKITMKSDEQKKKDKERIIAKRKSYARQKHPAVPPLLRGYTAKKRAGTSAGPPDPIGDCKQTNQFPFLLFST